MTTNTKFFDTKDQYITFRKAFANAVNDPRAKSSLVEQDSWLNPGTKIRVKKPGWIQAEHYMLLNLIRGLPYYRGFTPKTKKTCIENGHPLNQALVAAAGNLHRMVMAAKEIVDPKPVQLNSWQTRGKSAHEIEQIAEKANQQHVDRQHKAVAYLLEPLGNSVTIEQLAKVEVPSVPLVGSHALSSRIDEIVGKALTYAQINTILDEIAASRK